MGKIKQLASQTVWYGASNIIARLLNYLLTPFLTRVLHTPRGMADFGDVSIMYASISLVYIFYTYGFETAYFRFSNQEGVNRKTLFQTAFSSLVLSTIGLSLLLIGMRYPLSRLVEQNGHPQYVTLALLIISFDALSAIPFAKLRQENKPRRYAFVKITGVVINVLLTVVFAGLGPVYAASHPGSWYARWQQSHTMVELLLYANLIQNIFVFLILYAQWKGVKLHINVPLWKKLFAYSSPMIIIGLGGMINETMDRVMLAKMVPGPEQWVKTVVAVYSANYKLAIVITLFIQAFRMAAEPFFFNQASDKNAPKLYARVMKWFVIVMCLAFLTTVLYIDIWKLMVGEKYRWGLGVVPILLMANICLGIYYNQSVWYKLTDRMRTGMYITLLGVVITLFINTVFIPRYGMYASAWATFFCYFTMMVVSYLMGQHYFPVPYNLKKNIAYIVVMLILFFLQRGLSYLIPYEIVHLITGTIFMGLFLLLVLFAEKKELSAMPYIGKLIKRYMS